MSLSTNVSNLATRIATEVKAIRTLVNGNVADLSSLTTTEKTNLVVAINEINSALSGAQVEIGDLTELSTDAKNSLVLAINELQAEINNIDLSGIINDLATATNSTWSSSKINTQINSVGTSSYQGDTVVRRGESGEFSAGAVTVTELSLDSLNYPALTESQGALNVGNTSQDAALLGSSVDVTAQGGTLELTGFGINISSNAGNVTVDALEGNVILYGGGGVYVGDSESSQTEVATKGYVDTAEADAITTANAFAQSRINDESTSDTKTWSSTKISSEISGAVSALVDGAPELLNTLNELAAAINDDESFATTVTTALGTKADLTAVVRLTGDQDIAGEKNFIVSPIVPDSSFTIAKVTGLQNALDAKASTANVGDTTVNYVTTFEAGLV